MPSSRARTAGLVVLVVLAIGIGGWSLAPDRDAPPAPSDRPPQAQPRSTVDEPPAAPGDPAARERSDPAQAPGALSGPASPAGPTAEPPTGERDLDPAGGPPPLVPLPAHAAGIETAIEANPGAVHGCLSLLSAAPADGLAGRVAVATSPVDDALGYVQAVELADGVEHGAMVEHCLQAALGSQVFEAPAGGLLWADVVFGGVE